MAQPLFQAAPLIFMAMMLAFGLALAACSISDAHNR